MKRLVVFASGSGTNLQSIIDVIDRGHIDATITGLITSRKGVGALERAKVAEIKTAVIPPDSTNFASAIMEKLSDWRPDLIVLAGYTALIPGEVIQAYKNQIINIHPALLPRFGGKGFYGRKVHEAVLESGADHSGCTVHYVTEEYDRGPIIAQREVPVYADDTAETLARRVLAMEHSLYPEVIAKLISGKSAT
ncbi:MAG: phosphoribosylglycinamide formyltransferase [Balneolaceae bacterium]